MYNCFCCKETVSGKQVIHEVRRADNSIAASLPVCLECRDDLDAGLSPFELAREFDEAYRRKCSALKAARTKRDRKRALTTTH